MKVAKLSEGAKDPKGTDSPDPRSSNEALRTGGCVVVHSGSVRTLAISVTVQGALIPARVCGLTPWQNPFTVSLCVTSCTKGAKQEQTQSEAYAVPPTAA
jgi:hypothetical protein